MKVKLREQTYKLLALATISVLALGATFYHFVEHLDWIDSYYLSVVTLATVGYGDIVPKTDAGKLFTTLYIFIGVGIFTTFISYTLRRRAEIRASKRRDHEE